MTPISFRGQSTVFAECQPPYEPLPAHVDRMGCVTSCWRLSWRDRFTMLFTGRLWLSQLTFRQPLQPILPRVDKPEQLP